MKTRNKKTDLRSASIIVTNNNPKEIKVKMEYDEFYKLHRVDVRLKK